MKKLKSKKLKPKKLGNLILNSVRDVEKGDVTAESAIAFNKLIKKKIELQIAELKYLRDKK